MFGKDIKKKPDLVVVRVKVGHLNIEQRELKLKNTHEKVTKSLADLGYDTDTTKILVVDEDTEITKVM